jgi:outer membrane receptor protein involved in Fe transport
LANAEDEPKHRATAMANFTSNSFNNDFLGVGVEYAFREIFMLRGGYRYERDITNRSTNTFYTGYSAGATVQHRIGDKGPKIGIDYSFRPTHTPSNGVHTFSLRFMR